jgi:voltage-gated potassium channel
MMRIQKKINILLATIVLTIIAGSAGYYAIFNGEPSAIDCIYMTVISLTSVGYGEVLDISGNITAQIFTMVLITFGMGVILYAISTVTALLIEGELSGALRIKKMQKKISKLKSHYIVCGGGKTSQPLILELIKSGESVVLIESEAEKIALCAQHHDLLYIQGDATDDKNLILAGIHNATGILIVLPSDKDTLYVTMTARMLNNTIRIISQMTGQDIEPKLKKAGANRVVSPNAIGALRMASEMIRPTAVNFLDQMLRSEQDNIRIHEIIVTKKSGLEGKKIFDSNIKNRFNLMILGSKKHDSEEIVFNPPPSQTLTENMVLIVMGKVDDILNLKKTFRS